MISSVNRIEITITRTEVEALLLEANLIKNIQPKFNIRLKDDKSYAYVLLKSNHNFPQISKFRGKKNNDGFYFGPFPSSNLIHKTINSLSKAFLIRTCTDNYFSQRTRPCLQYQIKRCSAPCVGLIDKEKYMKQVNEAKNFLNGRSDKIQKIYEKQMEEASNKLDYETAALLRDKIKALSFIRFNNNFKYNNLIDTDIITIENYEDYKCIQICFIRSGINLGDLSILPDNSNEESNKKILEVFISQFYLKHKPPRQILISDLPTNFKTLKNFLENIRKSKIDFIKPIKGENLNLVNLVKKNAIEFLKRLYLKNKSQKKLFNDLALTLDFDTQIKRIEIYDNSHIQGKNAVGAMVVANLEGFVKSQYRKYNIKSDDNFDTNSRNDVAMMKQVIYRRFAKNISENFLENFPQLIIIDGGRGQLNAVYSVLKELNLNDIKLIGISKNKKRNSGMEKIHQIDKEAFSLPNSNHVMKFLQRLRDEAHRFAINTHRISRNRSNFKSPLDEIPEIGPKRKKSLLLHFGSAKDVATANLIELEKVDGISKKNALQIFEWFNSN